MGELSQWTSVRLRKSTLQRLVNFSRRRLKQLSLDASGAESRKDGKISLDAAVCVLLYREERSQERHARFRGRPRGERKNRIAFSDESE